MTVKRISRALTILALMLVLTLSALDSYSAEPQYNGPPQMAFVGSWIETFTPVPGEPPLKSIGVNNADGTSVSSEQATVRSKPVPHSVSSAIGVWKYLRDRTFGYSFI